MTLLRHVASATFGSQRYDKHIASVRADLALLPGVNVVRVTLPDPVPLDAGIGDSAEISLSAEGDATKMLTGEIAHIRRTTDGLEIAAIDAAGLLARSRPAATFEAQSLSDIARSLASDAGVTLGRADGPTRLAFYVADQTRTAAEHVARLAAIGGLIPSITATGLVEMATRPLGLPGSALLYGREFATYRVTEVAPTTPEPVPVGSGPAGFVPAPNIFQQSKKPLTVGAPDPGSKAYWRPSPVLRTPDAAAIAKLSSTAAHAARQAQLVADCWFQPQLRPGDLVQIQGLPGRLPAGPWLLSAVTHDLSPNASRTTVTGVAGGAALASTLSTIGGLL